MSWLLEADVMSQPAQRHGDQRVLAWLAREQSDIYTSTVVIAQLAYWVRRKQGRQREALQRWLRELVGSLEGRILSFNVGVAHVRADQKVMFERPGKSMPVEDSYISATARRYNLTIATGNDKDFRRPGVKVFNPFKELP